MFLDRHLRQLASVNHSGDPVLSLYVDTNRNDEAQRDRIRLFLKHESQRIRDEIGGNGHQAEVERGIQSIERYIADNVGTDTRGLAVFSCPTKDFFHAIELPVTVDATLSIGSRPSLRKLAQLRQDNPSAFVVLVDGKHARIVKLQFGTAQEVADLENDEVPRKHDQGGWSQANIQRHMQDHIDRHHKEAAELLMKMTDTGAVSIILAGQERNVANFRGFLNKHAEALVIGEVHLDIRATHDEIASACDSLLRAHGGRRTSELMEQLGTAKSNGRGVVGAQKVADSVNQRKLDHLLLSDKANAQGWSCLSCGILGESVPLACPACSGSVASVDLVEEFIAAAENESARVRFTGAFPLLDRHEGIGAILRF